MASIMKSISSISYQKTIDKMINFLKEKSLSITLPYPLFLPFPQIIYLDRSQIVKNCLWQIIMKYPLIDRYYNVETQNVNISFNIYLPDICIYFVFSKSSINKYFSSNSKRVYFLIFN